MFSWMLQAARTTPVAESKSITPESLAMFKRPCFWWYSSLQVAGRISSTSKIKKIGTRHGSQRWSIPVSRAPNFQRKLKGIEPSNQNRGGELSTPNNHKTMINNHSPKYPPVMGHTILQTSSEKNGKRASMWHALAPCCFSMARELWEVVRRRWKQHVLDAIGVSI